MKRYQASTEKTTGSTSFRQVAADSGGSLAIVALFLTMWLQHRRRTRG